MALFNSQKSQDQLFKDFHKKTGIQLIDEPIFDSDWEREGHLERIALNFREQPRKYIPILEQLIEERPTIPALKNYLQVAYEMVGNRAKVVELSDRILKEHPTYVFGISNKIMMITEKEEMQQFEHLLGNPKDVRELEGYDKPIHISAYKNYQGAAAYCEMMLGEDHAAVDRFETLLDLGIEKEFLDRIAGFLSRQRIKNMGEKMAKKQEQHIRVAGKQKVHLEQSRQAPEFAHKEIAIFYKKTIDRISERERKQIMALPKVTLIADLERVLVDAMKRYDFFFTDAHIKDNQLDIVHHALYFLGALEAKDSLPVVLDLLRMGEGFTEAWLNPMNQEASIYPTLYALGSTQLDILKAYLLEDEIHGGDKVLVTEMTCQIPMHEPDRRAEMIAWYTSIFQYLLTNEENKLLIDSHFIGFMVWGILRFRGKELLPLIEQVYHKGWIPDDIIGDLDSIKEEIQTPMHAGDLEPLPQDIHEYYSEVYQLRKAPPPPIAKEDQEKLDRFQNHRGEQYIMQQMMSAFKKSDLGDSEEYYERPTTIVRKEAKVGRNEPCPCGSGKKYKKCCLRKK